MKKTPLYVLKLMVKVSKSSTPVARISDVDLRTNETSTLALTLPWLRLDITS